MRFLTLSVLILLLIPGKGKAQLETRWIDSTTYGNHSYGYFFSNRPLKKSEEGVVTLRNRWTRQTGNLYFCLYDYEKDSIMLKYQATKTSDLDVYPTEAVQNNIFYGIYDNMVVKRGIQSLIFVIPGYGKTFNEQVKDFMFRLKKNYMDTLSESMAIIMFAWGDQSIAPFYHKGRRAANRAANDFAIYQHMLEDFLADSTYFEQHPAHVSYSLLCTSMGNQVLKEYLIKREKRGIDLVPAYDRIIMIGSDAACNSFEAGKGFHNITEMTGSVSILVNRKDGPLSMSQYMNMTNRLGKEGPTNIEKLPKNIRVYDITGLISWEDLPAMGHDYLLRNSAIRDSLLFSELQFQESQKRKSE
jgi:hypothetical protein